MNKSFYGILANNLFQKNIVGKGILGKGIIEFIQTKLGFLFGEIGNVDASTVVIIFNKPVMASGDNFVTGVTIKVDGVQVSVSGGLQQTDQRIINYSLQSSVATGQNITWEYNATIGSIADLQNEKLASVSPQNIANNVLVLSYLLDFSSANNSFYVPLL